MKTAVVLGTFDGLHKGHRAVIGAASGFYTVAVTFDIPPKAYFRRNLKLLMTPEDKEAGLKALGVNEIYSLDFSKVCDTSPEDFFGHIVKKFSPSLIVCGFNYRFGKAAAGDIKKLAAFCAGCGIELKIVESVGGDKPVSSSALRVLIANGDVAAANEQIYGGFGFSSSVLHGDQRGRTFGFPTVNQAFPAGLIPPKFGVYASKVIVDGKEYRSITNLGIRPTYKTDFIGCETFIKDFTGDIYGKTVTLKLLRFIRPERMFSSKRELLNTVKADIESVLGVKV